MFTAIVIGTLIILLGTGIVAIRNLLVRIEFYEDFVSSLSNKLLSILTRLDRIDERGHFKTDDEVQYIFEDIEKVVRELEDFLIPPPGENE